MKSRGLLIAGNWKMNHGPKAAREFLSGLEKTASHLIGVADLRCVIFAPAVTLEAALAARGKSPVEIGAQNAWGEKSGAFTGELSAPLLQEIGIYWVLVGHSERRQLFGETDQGCRSRVDGLITQGMHVVFCLGETLAERNGGKTETVLERQLSAILPDDHCPGAKALLDGCLVIAYEPVWAIGTGVNASPEQAQAAHLFIRGYLRNRCSPAAAERASVLYGGSVTPENAAALLTQPDVDGALVGGASLKAQSFGKLMEIAHSLLA